MGWYVVKNNAAYGGVHYSIYRQKILNGTNVERCVAQSVWDIATAKLIAAAPEMRELLERAADYINDGLVGEGEGYYDVEGHELYTEITKLLNNLEAPSSCKDNKEE